MDWNAGLDSVLQDWNKRALVASPDIDGLLAAALLCHLYQSRVIGIYTTRHLLLFDGASPSDTMDALWVDHDISHPGVRCIGQHLVLHSSKDSLPRRHEVSFNPNVFYRQSAEDSFKGRKGRSRDKYPFATVHILLSALDAPIPRPGTTAYSLLAHPDGSWATPLDYPANCQIWHELMFQDFGLITNLVTDYTDSTDHLVAHREMLEELVERGITARGSSNKKTSGVPSEWTKLEGHQSVRYQRNWSANSFLSKVLGILDYIALETGWVVPDIGVVTDIIEGNVVRRFPDSIPRGTFDDVMVEEEIFSHAITNITELRYTNDINLAMAS